MELDGSGGDTLVLARFREFFDGCKKTADSRKKRQARAVPVGNWGLSD